MHLDTDLVSFIRRNLNILKHDPNWWIMSFLWFIIQLLHSPQDFSTAMERLCEQVKQIGSEGGEHLCFFGSGREQEDQYMYMVVSKFLQQSIPYVSMTRGGFLGT